MSEHEDNLRLSWTGGPALALSRTEITVLPPHCEAEDAVAPAMAWLRGIRCPWMWGPKPLTDVKLEFDGERLLYYRKPRLWEFWLVPPEHSDAVRRLVEEFHRRRELREMHEHPDAGRGSAAGRSLLPWLLLVAVCVWLVWRARRSR